MKRKYAIAYCDGYYITENGRGILDLAHTQDQEFAIFVRDALNAAQPLRAADAATPCPYCKRVHDSSLACPEYAATTPRP